MKKLHKIGKNRATEFSKDLLRLLQNRKRRSGEPFGGLQWEKNWRLPNGQTVDVAGYVKGQRSRPVVLIEAELLREDPSSNVVKIWKWSETRKPRTPLLFVQSFTKPYRARKKERFERAIFIAGKMSLAERSISYRSVRLNYNPRIGAKVGAGKRRHHARNLGYTVVRLWNRFHEQNPRAGK